MGSYKGRTDSTSTRNDRADLREELRGWIELAKNELARELRGHRWKTRHHRRDLADGDRGRGRGRMVRGAAGHAMMDFTLVVRAFGLKRTGNQAPRQKTGEDDSKGLP